jgi:dihydropteroate synthase
MLLHCGSRILDLSTPVVMGVLNVTPDSFSDGGRFANKSRALEHAATMVAAGATIIDVGGESTRPGAVAVSLDEELERVVPIIDAIAQRHDVVISVDTSKPDVAVGAGMINDVRALTEPGALQAAAASDAAVCLMHMKGQPATMQATAGYQDVLSEVREFLQARLQVCQHAGIAANRLVIDPGIGFGKTIEHNLALLAHLPVLHRLGAPLLIGVSRKRMIGTLLDRAVEQRLPGGLALATAAVLAGALIIRSHDVAATRDVVRTAQALRQAGYSTQ